MGLFEKLQVCNAYAAVQTAYYNKILKTKEYTPEKVKGIALKYADLFQKIKRVILFLKCFYPINMGIPFL